MTRGRILALAVVAVTVVVVVIAAVFVFGWRNGKGGSYAPRHIAVHTAVTPDRSVFGQPIQATVSVTVDPSRVDPSSVQQIVDFKPFAVRSDSESRSRIGRAIVLTHHYTLQCVVFGCVPFGQTGSDGPEPANRDPHQNTRHQHRPIPRSGGSKDIGCVRNAIPRLDDRARPRGGKVQPQQQPVHGRRSPALP